MGYAIMRGSRPDKSNERRGSVDDNRKQALAAALTQIERQFGKGAIMRLGDGSAMHDVSIISTGSLALDLALGIGGLPRGRVVEVYGPESSGKTTLALQVIAECQENGGTAVSASAHVPIAADSGHDSARERSPAPKSTTSRTALP